MDKTFAETQGFAPFDWNLFLSRAVAGDISEDEHLQAKRLAGEWTTCACGNQCAIIPRQPGGFDAAGNYRMPGAPEDPLLSELGIDFFAMIKDKNYTAARTLLHRIELRSSELISHQLALLSQGQEKTLP